MKSRANRGRKNNKTRKQGGSITSIITTPIKIWFNSLVEAVRYPVTGIFVTPIIFTIMLYISFRLMSCTSNIQNFVNEVNSTIDISKEITPEVIKILITGLEEHEQNLQDIKNKYNNVMDFTIQIFGDSNSGIYALNRRTYGSTMTNVDRLTKMLHDSSIKLHSINSVLIVKKNSNKVKTMLDNISSTADDLKEDTEKTIEPMTRMKKRSEKLTEKLQKGCAEGKVVNPATLRCKKFENDLIGTK